MPLQVRVFYVLHTVKAPLELLAQIPRLSEDAVFPHQLLLQPYPDHFCFSEHNKIWITEIFVELEDLFTH